MSWSRRFWALPSVSNVSRAPVLEIGFESKFLGERLHRDICEAANSLIASGRTADPETLRPFLPIEEEVGETTVGEYLLRLCAEAVAVMHANDYAPAVLDA